MGIGSDGGGGGGAAAAVVVVCVCPRCSAKASPTCTNTTHQASALAPRLVRVDIASFTVASGTAPLAHLFSTRGMDRIFSRFAARAARSASERGFRGGTIVGCMIDEEAIGPLPQ